MMDEYRVYPKQPFFVLATNKYSKVLLYKYGISHFYSFSMDENMDERVVAIPDGCIDIIFCYNGRERWAHICGTVLKAQAPFSGIRGAYEIFGVRFMPGVTPAGFEVKMADLIGGEKVLSDVEKEAGFSDKMLAAENFADRHAIFMEYYLRHYTEESQFNAKEGLINFVGDEIVKNAGMVSIAEIAEKAGYSDRYINKAFKEEYGMVPKQFAKIMRFQYLLDHLTLAEGEEVDFAELSVMLGYYDQPHMIKNFKEYTEITPQKYLKLMNQEQFSKRLIIQ